MDTIKKMNHIFHVTILLSAIFNSITSFAAPYVIESNDVGSLSRESYGNYNDIMSNQDVTWGRVTNVNIELLVKSDTLQLFLDNEQIELFMQYRNDEVSYSYTHYTSLNKEEEAFLSILENNIQGDVRTTSGRYHITSISATDIAIVKYEFDIPEEPEREQSALNSEDEAEENINLESVVPSTTPVIRVLFLYTPSALTLVGYPQALAMRNVAYTYINQANESFANSNINAHMELAYLGQTNYNESAHSWDDALDYFYDTDDGYMDEVHTLRNKHSADVCVLFLNKNDYCGEAKKISADDDEAFCLVHPIAGCNSKFTAIHEIGHLIGCRHNLSQDYNMSPYMYGHGYYHYENNNSNASWRTMMSYDNSCATECQRILYWSNPDKTYNGNAMGTSTFENNARVWNERATTVSNFRDSRLFIMLNGSNNNTSSLYESYTSLLSISTSSGYEVQSGQTVDFAANGEIRLMPNTHIKSGANFRASIRNNADEANYPQFIAKRKNDANIEVENQRFEVYPNPVHDILTISTSENLAVIGIYNLNGQCVWQTNEVIINVVNLPVGVYILRAVTSDGNLLQSKFIKR